MAETSLPAVPLVAAMAYEVDSDYEMDVDLIGENEDAHAANNQLLESVVASRVEDYEDAPGEDDDMVDGGEGGVAESDSSEEDEENEDDEDAEGESDDELDNGAESLQNDNEHDDEESRDGDDGEEIAKNAEAVGAVKFRPEGEDDDDDVSLQDEDDDSDADLDDASESSSNVESEAVDWPDAEGEDEELLEKNANPSGCV